MDSFGDGPTKDEFDDDDEGFRIEDPELGID